MTLLPAPPALIGGGNNDLEVQANEQCATPSCKKPATEKHHIVRRSYLSGPYDWVEIDDNNVLNVVWLCNKHHLQATDNKISIQWIAGSTDGYEWVEHHQDSSAGRMSPMPRHEHPTHPIPTEGLPLTPLESEDIAPPPDPSGAVGTTEDLPRVCPECHRAIPKPKSAPEPKRERKILGIRVPVDERENGVELLETLLEQSKVLVGRGIEEPHYYVLVMVLYYFVQNYSDE